MKRSGNALITLQPSSLFAQKPRIAILILSSKHCPISGQEYSILTAFWPYLLATWLFHPPQAQAETHGIEVELNHITNNDPW
jgi:hypothetical protein